MGLLVVRLLSVVGDRMNFGTLFSGIEGFGLGFEQAGMTCKWQCEIDKHAIAVLKHQFKDTKRFKDVKKIGGRKLEPVSLICGGFPCQDVSVAGKRKGLAGERSGLWFHFHRIIEEIQPSWVVIENVPGLLSSNKGKDFGVILGGLVECGYGTTWRVLDSQYFGVAQRRRRLFIVGSLGNGSSAEVLFESESLSRNPAESRKKREGVAGTTQNGIESCSYDGSQITDTLDVSMLSKGQMMPDKKRFPCVIEEKTNVNALTTNPYADNLSQEDKLICQKKTADPVIFEPFSEDGAPRIQKKGISPTLRTNQGGLKQPCICIPINTMTAQGRPSDKDRMGSGIGKNGDPANTISQAHCHAVCFDIHTNDGGPNKRKDRPNGGMYINKVDKSLTIGSPNKTLSVQKSVVRRLTPRECERLQGFPDDWTKYGIDENGKKIEISDTQRYKTLGNAVTVSVAKWIGERILKNINLKPCMKRE